MPTSEALQTIDLSAKTFKSNDPAYQEMLADLQGDILKPNGRNYATHIVFSFTGSRAQVHTWLSALGKTYITSAAKQLRDVTEYRLSKANGGLFGTLGLTVAAYEWLGFELPQIPRDRNARFLAGMADGSTQQLLNDPPVSCWDAWSQGTQPIHAVLNLFDDSQTVLASAVTSIQTGAAGIATVLTVQNALRLRNAAGQSIEPFGFVDGISQPLFLEDELPSLPEGAFDPSAPLSLALIPDPNGAGSNSHGSFFVYRKLQQDVSSFQRDTAALASALKCNAALAGAYVVGRFQDGTPVIDADDPTSHMPPDNTFQYAKDPEAGKCPFQAHIRKANPRGDTVRSNGAPIEVERSHRIVRRAFSYQNGPEETGLHFFCYQSDIGNQFEFIQSAWSNMTHFLRMTTGLDGVIGQAAPTNTCTRPSSAGIAQAWPNAWNDPGEGTTSFDFGRWVSLKGGDYFFAPSLSFFTTLVERT